MTDKLFDGVLESGAKYGPNEICCVKTEFIDGKLIHTPVSYSELYEESEKVFTNPTAGRQGEQPPAGEAEDTKQSEAVGEASVTTRPQRKRGYNQRKPK